MNIIKNILIIIIGLGTGMVVSGAIFAFLVMIGIIPRIATKTKTEKYINLYEEMILYGGLFGTIVDFFNLKFQVSNLVVVVYGLAEGIFIGILAVSLAEVLDVIPVLSSRFKIKKYVGFTLVSIALGKLVGSLVYFIVFDFV